MYKILITGATGFVGSALAASLLAEDVQVVALSRNDPGGQRTRAAVERAASGFGFAVRGLPWNRLSVVEVDFHALDQTLDPRVLEGVTAVWNVAAEMTYSLRRVLDSVNQNVVASTMLYQLVSLHAPDCRRFYHVSTAYTAGFGNHDAREEINFTPRLINAYQLSKWMAEIALVHRRHAGGPPLTIFRPSIVIGHEQTGWSTGASFGMFLLAAALLHAKRSGVADLRLDLAADNRANLVCVDTVVRRAMALTRAESSVRPATEIFHCIGDESIRTGDVVACMQSIIGVRVSFGEPVDAMDTRINAMFEPNKQFANERWTFHADRLKQVLGEDYGPLAITQDVVGRSVQHYVAQQLAATAAEKGRSNAA